MADECHMAAHKVELTISHPVNIGNVDVVFEVRNGNALLGKLEISKGGVDWRKAHSKSGPKSATWAEFAEWMQTKG
jgi:hypothetical protein